MVSLLSASKPLPSHRAVPSCESISALRNGASSYVPKSRFQDLLVDTVNQILDLSPAAARQRVLQLIDEGVISIVAVSDPTVTGQLAQAMVGIKVQGDIDEVVTGVEAHSEVVYLLVTAGRFDLLAEILCEDTNRLLEVLQDIRMQPGVLYAEVFTYLRLEKQTYNWGVA